ncbi:PilZ domain-containing protein [Thermodesulfovibrio sp.]|uniref:PilZ domain-containing protein n=1 Tax=Thermodesulfovibrio sp. TaxID=2067987 RepID=UPI0030A35B45
MEDYENMREFARINVSIPIKIYDIKAQDIEKLETEIIGDVDFSIHDMPEILTGNEITQKLEEMNTKLNAIMNLLLLQQRGLSGLPEKLVNLSAGGIGFLSEISYNIGSFVGIKMILSISKSFVGIITHGEVIRCNKINGHYDIGIRFINMKDWHKDIIVRFVISKEREKRKRT